MFLHIVRIEVSFIYYRYLCGYHGYNFMPYIQPMPSIMPKSSSNTNKKKCRKCYIPRRK